MSPRRPEHRRAYGLRARADVASIVLQAVTQWRAPMRFPSWLRPLAARLNPARKRQTRSRPACRPRVERLEDRCVPALVNWVGGSGDWGDAANWSTGARPGPTDDVVIGPA